MYTAAARPHFLIAPERAHLSKNNGKKKISSWPGYKYNITIYKETNCSQCPTPRSIAVWPIKVRLGCEPKNANKGNKNKEGIISTPIDPLAGCRRCRPVLFSSSQLFAYNLKAQKHWLKQTNLLFCSHTVWTLFGRLSLYSLHFMAAVIGGTVVCRIYCSYINILFTHRSNSNCVFGLIVYDVRIQC